MAASIFGSTRMPLAAAAAAGLATIVITAGSGDDRLRYPPARRDSLVETLGGHRVADPYRWMEQIDSPETQSWVRAQEQLLSTYLRGAPERAVTRERLLERLHYEQYGTPVKRGARIFYSTSEAGGARSRLLVEEEGRSRAVLDVASLGEDARMAAYVPSPDGRLLAVSVRRNQSNWNDVVLIDADRGALLPDRVTNVYSFSSRVAWRRDGSGFFYTAFDAPAASEAVGAARHARVMHHRIGDAAAADTPMPGLPRRDGWLYSHAVSEDGGWLVVTASRGSSQRDEIYLARLDRPAPRLARLDTQVDAAFTFLGAAPDRLFFYTDFEAERGRIVAIEPDAPAPSRWTEIVPPQADAIAARDQTGGNALGMYGNRFVLTYLRDGQPYVVIHDLEGRRERTVELPTAGAIWGGFSGRQSDAEVFYAFLGLTDPSTIYRLDLNGGAPRIFRSSPVRNFDRSRYDVRQVFVTSGDGTRVPMFVAHRKGIPLDGRNRTWMYGYGAMGWVSFLYYQPQVLLWLENGGVYAQPSLRGGGEYGDSWHRAGSGVNEQNTIDDYLAAARWLIDRKYTSPPQLVAHGGSLSGALAGAAMNQHPHLFGAALIDRPVLDLLRYDRFTGGAYWAGELGATDDPAALAILRRLSPYHNIRRGACHPPTLVMTGDRDQTAVPAHAYKYVAAMQHAQSCARPVLLKVMRGAGHNFGASPEAIADSHADALMFLDLALPRPGR
jgi:prolyl oligopeptidase